RRAGHGDGAGTAAEDGAGAEGPGVDESRTGVRPGSSSYHWLRARALAALGDYALAEEECEQLIALGRGQEGPPAWEAMAQVVGQTVLNEQPVGASVAVLPFRAVDRRNAFNRVAALAKDLRQVANANVCRGLLLLEEGEVEEAEVSFRLALALWKDEEAAASGEGLGCNGRPSAQRGRARRAVGGKVH